MKYAEIAKRYAAALFQVAEETDSYDRCYEELKQVSQLLQDDTFREFANSPLIKASDKEALVKKVLAEAKLSKEVESLVLLLAKKDRLPILNDLVSAYEQKNDERNGLTRGVVRSAEELPEQDRRAIEKAISDVVGKKVLLDFVKDKNVIAGVVATVGSLTFDDSLSSHLRRMKESLNRSLH